MKKYLILLLITFATFSLYSQKGEKIESLKIGFLTNKLNLDANTAQKFWPLYNQYEAEMKAIVQEKRRMNHDDTRSAYEILDQEQKALDIKKKYNAQFSKVISNDQLNRLYNSEKEFRQMIINRSQNRDIHQELNRPNRDVRDRPLERKPDGRIDRMESRPERLQRPENIQRGNQNVQQAPAPTNDIKRERISR